MSRRGKWFLALLIFITFGCNEHQEPLPILGELVYDEYTGEHRTYRAPQFDLVNQYSAKITDSDFNKKIYIADFFFTSCPTICPQMTKNLKIINEEFSDEKRVRLISFSIDPKRDTPDRLLRYIQDTGLNDSKWDFLTGDKDDIYELAKDYKVRVFDDGRHEGEDILHDGTFVLVDEIGQIRGYYNGLERRDMGRLIQDINILKKE